MRNARGQFCSDPLNPPKRKRSWRNIPDNASLKEVLYIVDTWAARSGNGRRLWQVVSAMRGPDCYSADGRKHELTTFIRGAAFPKSAVQGGAYVREPISRFLKLPNEERNRLARCYFDVNHYESHCKLAAAVLGIQYEDRY